MRRALHIGAATLLILSGCAASGGGGGEEIDPASTGGPRVDGVRPSSGRAGVAYPIEVTLTGGPFDATGNVVRFGPWTAGTFDSSDGTTIVFQLPKTLRMSVEVPPMVVPAGVYEIVVETSSGVSDPVEFTLTEGEAR